jgi:lycopene beta-cyclase
MSVAGSVLTLENGDKVRCKLLIDASGLESRLVAKETPMLARNSEQELATGYQIAYGFLAHVSSLGPYNDKAMTLFDYRTDHLAEGSSDLKDACSRPTFMYAMPLRALPDGSHLCFFEETSLVGRGPRRLSFEECQSRAMKRLAFHGITVLGIEEEEYCYIPMGGELPDLTQRIIAFGGAANMVHPSTGYHACRMLAASTDIAQVLGDGVRSKESPDLIASKVYRTLWSQQNRGQRDFQAYGGDFLMEQPVDKLRGFFSAFFACKQVVWGGFLAGWPGLPGNSYHKTWSARLSFALELFFKMPPDVGLSMVLYSIMYTVKFGPNTLLRSLTPAFLFGAGPSDSVYSDLPETLGDTAAKIEARNMMKAFTPTAKVTYNKKEPEKVDSTYPAPFN